MSFIPTLVCLTIAVILVLPLQASRGPREGVQEPNAGEKPAGGLVLRTDETLDFTTDEVTWMSIDISPDGRTIVFDLLGDLYTMPATGGAATRIMGGLSFESQPTFSPDGKTIAFISDRSGVENLWIANADGSNTRAVSKDGRTNDQAQIMLSPAWTPDGDFLIVSKSRPPDPGTMWLYMYVAVSSRRDWAFY